MDYVSIPCEEHQLWNFQLIAKSIIERSEIITRLIFLFFYCLKICQRKVCVYVTFLETKGWSDHAMTSSRMQKRRWNVVWSIYETDLWFDLNINDVKLSSHLFLFHSVLFFFLQGKKMNILTIIDLRVYLWIAKRLFFRLDWIAKRKNTLFSFLVRIHLSQ